MYPNSEEWLLLDRRGGGYLLRMKCGFFRRAVKYDVHPSRNSAQLFSSWGIERGGRDYNDYFVCKKGSKSACLIYIWKKRMWKWLCSFTGWGGDQIHAISHDIGAGYNPSPFKFIRFNTQEHEFINVDFFNSPLSKIQILRFPGNASQPTNVNKRNRKYAICTTGSKSRPVSGGFNVQVWTPSSSSLPFHYRSGLRYLSNASTLVFSPILLSDHVVYLPTEEMAGATAGQKRKAAMAGT